MNYSQYILTHIRWWYLRSVSYQIRNYSKYIRQTPKEKQVIKDENLPIYQYATENTKRKKRVYMWGNVMLGALGNSDFVRTDIYNYPLESLKRPWRLPFAELHKVRDICCGHGFTVFAASNQENDFSLFGTGMNCDFQIGYHCSKQNRPLAIVTEPVPIALPLSNKSSIVVRVGCGRAHTVAVTDTEVFSLGSNNCGQCGVPDGHNAAINGILKVHKMENIDEPIVKVVCGQDHTLLLTKSGTVYSCGKGADGQTGLGHNNNQFTPSRVKGDMENEKIVQLSCCTDCVLALSEKGDVFGWGNSEYAQLKTATDKQQINIPRHLKLNLGKVTSVAAGSTMCGLVNESGSVYVWGYGILGQGPEVSVLYKPSLLPPPLFGVNEFSPDVKVEQLVAGMNHFAAITNQGHLYMWGKNNRSCLGLNITRHQFFPLKVCIPAEVIKVSCGTDHTAVLARGFT